MAYTTYRDDDEKDKGQGQGAGQAGGSSSGDSFAGGAGGGASSPMQNLGANQLAPFTNIQAYLNANQGNTGGSDLLKNQVGGAFDTERKNFDTGKTDYENSLNSGFNQYQGEAQKDLSGLQGARSKMAGIGLNDLYGGNYNMSQYNYQPQALNQYQAPQYQGYGLGAETQSYGQGLNSAQNEKPFQNLMSGLYGKNVTGQFGQGQQTLQNQIDLQNPSLDTTRQGLLTNYNTLNTDVGNANTGEAAAQKDKQGQANTLQSQYQQQAGKFNSDLSGLQNAIQNNKYYDEGYAPYAGGVNIHDAISKYNLTPDRFNQIDSPNNPTWQGQSYVPARLQNFQNILKGLKGQYGFGG